MVRAEYARLFRHSFVDEMEGVWACARSKRCSTFDVGLVDLVGTHRCRSLVSNWTFVSRITNEECIRVFSDVSNLRRP